MTMRENWTARTSEPRAQAVALSAQEKATLNAVVGELIPASADGFPSAADAGVGEFILVHLAPEDDQQLIHGLQAIAEAGGRAFQALPREMRVDALRRVEAQHSEFFTLLLLITYYGYYASALVAQSIRAVLGYEYNDHPQPLGYRLPAFDASDPLQKPAKPRGAYLATEAVSKVTTS